MTPTGHLPDGNRVIFTYHNQEHDSRSEVKGKSEPQHLVNTVLTLSTSLGDFKYKHFHHLHSHNK